MNKNRADNLHECSKVLESFKHHLPAKHHGDLSLIAKYIRNIADEYLQEIAMGRVATVIKELEKKITDQQALIDQQASDIKGLNDRIGENGANLIDADDSAALSEADILLHPPAPAVPTEAAPVTA